MVKSNGKRTAWTRQKIAKLSPAEFDKYHDEIEEWIKAGAPEGKSADDPTGLRLPSGYRLTRRDVAKMNNEEFAANADKVRDAVASGDLT